MQISLIEELHEFITEAVSDELMIDVEVFEASESLYEHRKCELIAT